MNLESKVALILRVLQHINMEHLHNCNRITRSGSILPHVPCSCGLIDVIVELHDETMAKS